MAIPDYQSLMLPILRVAADGETKVSDCIKRLVSELPVTENDLSEMLPSGRQTVFSNRVHWAKNYMAKAGLIEITRRAHFRITERGQKVLAKHPFRIDNKILAQFPEFVEWRERSDTKVKHTSQGSDTADPTARRLCKPSEQ